MKLNELIKMLEGDVELVGATKSLPWCSLLRKTRMKP